MTGRLVCVCVCVGELARRKSAARGGKPLEGTFSESQCGRWRAVGGRGGREADVIHECVLLLSSWLSASCKPPVEALKISLNVLERERRRQLAISC